MKIYSERKFAIKLKPNKRNGNNRSIMDYKEERKKRYSTSVDDNIY